MQSRSRSFLLVLTPSKAPKPKKPRRSLDELSRRLREDPSELSRWVLGRPAEYSYRSFTIPKRSGRLRFINAPNELLGKLQRKVYRRLLAHEPLQAVVTGFVCGKSIVHNVKDHLNSQIIVKADLTDFFTSIEDERIDEFWRSLGWDAQCCAILTGICCKDGVLPQGAPTSPALSNLVNRGFDGSLSDLARRYEARYTRYADDLTFSWPKHHRTATKRMRSLIDQLCKIVNDEGYRIQKGKGIKILRPHQRQVVTGLVINQSINLPRETRKKIRALKYLAEQGKLSESDLQRLEGYKLLEQMVMKGARDYPNATDHKQKASQRLHLGPALEYSKFQSVNVEVVQMKNVVQGDQIFGSQNKAGDNIGGIQYVGQFQNTRTKLEQSGQSGLASTLNELMEAIERSSDLSVEEKSESCQGLHQIADETLKESPSKTKIKMLWNGVFPILKLAADVASIAAAVAPCISQIT